MTQHNKFAELNDSIKAYVNTTYELTILKATEKAANVGSEAISTLLILKALSFAILLLTFAAAFYIASVLDETYLGFLIVGGAYFVITLFLLLGRNSLLKKPFRNIIIKALFKQHQ